MKLKRDDFSVLKPSGQFQKSQGGPKTTGVEPFEPEGGDDEDETEGTDSDGNSKDDDGTEKIAGKGIGATLTPEESEELQRALGVPVEHPDEGAADKIIEEAKRHVDKLTSNRGSIGGRGDGLLRRAIARLAQPKTNWKELLKRFIGGLMSSSEMYMGSRRHLHTGDYLYGEKWKFDALEKCAVAIDVSGSIMGDFPEFLAEVSGIAHAKKIKEIHVLPFAETVHDVVVIKGKKPEPSDFSHVKLGGGAENITAIKDYIQNKMGNKIGFCVIITDGHLTTGLPHPPKAGWGKNTIWLVYNNPTFEETYKFPASWGKVIHVKFEPKKK